MSGHGACLHLDAEKQKNERALLEAQLEQQARATAVRANSSVKTATAEAEAQRIRAIGLQAARMREAETDALWLGNPARSRLEERRLDPLGHLIGTARAARWPMQ